MFWSCLCLLVLLLSALLVPAVADAAAAIVGAALLVPGAVLVLGTGCAARVVVGTVCAVRAPAPRNARPKAKADPVLRGLLLLAAGAVAAPEGADGAALVSAAVGAVPRSAGGVRGGCDVVPCSIAAQRKTHKLENK